MQRKIRTFLSFLLIGFAYVCVGQNLEIIELDKRYAENPSEAISAALSTFQKKEKNLSPKDQTEWIYTITKYYGRAGQYEECLPWAKKGYKIAKKHNEKPRIGDFCNALGNTFLALSRADSAVVYYLEGAGILEELKEYMKSGFLLNNLSNVYIDDQRYDLALTYLKRSEALLDKVGGPTTPSYGTTLGNIAHAYINLDSLDQAKIYAQKTLQVGKKQNDPKTIVYGLISLGDLEKKRQDSLNAAKYYLDAYTLADKNQDAYRKAQSAFNLANMLQFSKPRESIKYALESDQFYKTNLPRFRGDILKLLGQLYKQIGDSQQSMTFFEAYSNTQDSLHKIEFDRVKLNLLEQYEAAEKNKIIDQQKLELTEKKLKISQLIFGLILAVVVALFSIFFFLSQKKINREKIKKLALEKEQSLMMALIEGESKERSRLAKELHDGIANEAAALKMKVELENLSINSPLLNQIVKKLEELHQNTRNTAHALLPKSLINGDLVGSIEYLCEEFSGQTKINFTHQGYLINKPKSLELFIYRLIQESVGNAVRHGQAEFVTVKLIDDGKNIEITIQDDGKGIQKDKLEKGFGYLQSRIKELGGKIEVDSQINHGTNIKIIISYAL